LSSVSTNLNLLFRHVHLLFLYLQMSTVKSLCLFFLIIVCSHQEHGYTKAKMCQHMFLLRWILVQFMDQWLLYAKFKNIINNQANHKYNITFAKLHFGYVALVLPVPKMKEESSLFILQFCFKFTFNPKTFVWFKIDLELPNSIKRNLELHKSIV
jgi:hypothetical protein